MKQFTLMVCIFLCMFGFAQETGTPTSREVYPQASISNLERYNVDYKIINFNFPNGDSTILNLINLDALEIHRSMDEDVQVTDPVTGLDLILFHAKNSEILPVKN